MKNVYSVIKAPVITEKSTIQAEIRKAIFWVDLEANKRDVKVAVEKIFNVKVASVNTQRVPGKMKRMGKFEGQKQTRKKAYVTLKEGEKIELFEGV